MENTQQIKNILNQKLLNNEISIIEMIMNYLTDDCDICEQKCFDTEQEIMDCCECNESYHVCFECYKKNKCDSCDYFICFDCQENDNGLRKCDSEKCNENFKYCDDCRTENLGYCQSCEESKCCVKVFKSIDIEGNYIYTCQDCLECVFNP